MVVNNNPDKYTWLTKANYYYFVPRTTTSKWLLCWSLIHATFPIPNFFHRNVCKQIISYSSYVFYGLWRKNGFEKNSWMWQFTQMIFIFFLQLNFFFSVSLCRALTSFAKNSCKTNFSIYDNFYYHENNNKMWWCKLSIS